MSQTTQELLPADKRSDEQKTFDHVNEIITILLACDPDTRQRIYATVGAFFSYDAPPGR